MDNLIVVFTPWEYCPNRVADVPVGGVLYKQCYTWGILKKCCCDSTCYGNSLVCQHYLYNTTLHMCGAPQLNTRQQVTAVE